MDGFTAVATRLVELAGPFVASEDWEGLSAALEGHWSPDCLELLLVHSDPQCASFATICMGLIGGIAQAPAVARLLYHEQPDVAEAAEDALWSIWFREGGTEGQRLVSKAAALLDRELPQRAIPLLDGLLQGQPMFAEGYHQRALAHCMLGNSEAAVRDARRACKLNPLHFAAWACQGNCHCSRGEYAEALTCYREAIRIHPRLDVVRQSIRELRDMLNEVEA